MFPIDRAGVRLQVVVAHPDDETFGCGSLLLHAAAAGAVTSVVCATRGEAGQVAEGISVPAGGLAVLREEELRAAAELLAVQTVELLDFGDSGMDGTPAPGTLAGADPDEVRTLVERAVSAFAPDVLVTLDGTDGHRDHAVVRDVTIAIGRSEGVPVYLSCLPRAAMRRWAAHMEEVDPSNTYLHLGELGTPDELVTQVLDTSEHLPQRWRAIRAHRSQASPFDALPERLAKLFLSSEHLRLVDAG